MQCCCPDAPACLPPVFWVALTPHLLPLPFASPPSCADARCPCLCICSRQSIPCPYLAGLSTHKGFMPSSCPVFIRLCVRPLCARRPDWGYRGLAVRRACTWHAQPWLAFVHGPQTYAKHCGREWAQTLYNSPPPLGCMYPASGRTSPARVRVGILPKHAPPPASLRTYHTSP